MLYALVTVMATGLWQTVNMAPPAATPPMPCGTYPQILEQLGQQYAEQPVSLGVQTNGDLLELLSSEQGETWTILSLAPNGLACVVAAGSNWGEADKMNEDSKADEKGV